jgi:hypothetical protein
MRLTFLYPGIIDNEIKEQWDFDLKDYSFSSTSTTLMAHHRVTKDRIAFVWEVIEQIKWTRSTVRDIGGYWIDDQNNKWSDTEYSEEDAERYSKSLRNSHNCMNCTKCVDCKECEECYNCSNCEDCYNCTSCVTCEGCISCVKCNNCIDCKYCDNCTSCVRRLYKLCKM